MSLLRKKTWQKPRAISLDEFLNSKPVTNPHLTWARSDKGEIAVTIKPENQGRKGFSKLFFLPKEKKIVLDKIGTFVWERCDGNHSVKQIAEELSKEYKMMRQEAETALSKYLQQLAERGMVGVISPKPKRKSRQRKQQSTEK